jgi:hypothetical protein
MRPPPGSGVGQPGDYTHGPTQIIPFGAPQESTLIE